MTERQQLEYLKELRSSKSNKINLSIDKREEITNRKKRWITLWRKNINLYIHYKLGIRSFPFQHFAYYIMGDSTTYMDISTRGVSKSFKAVVFATAMCMLYPGYKVGIAAVSRAPADEDYQATFLGEIVNKLSPIIKYLWDNGLIVARETEKGYLVTFWNNSSILFFPCIDSSRGAHVNLLIIEECRLIKKTNVDSIAIPMHTQRQPAYKLLPEYMMRRDLDEPVRLVYITSNRFNGEWFNTVYNKTFVAYFKDKLNKHRVFNADIFLAIKYGLKSKEWLISQRNSMDELNYRMELLNETCGEAEDAYYTLEMFQKNQVLRTGFVPPTIEQFINGDVKNRSKEPDEIRFIWVDFAFVDSIEGGKENDNTVIGCGAIVKRNNHWVRLVEYLETCSGSKKDHALLRIREIFWDYSADYIIYDNRNGGTVNYTDLTKPFNHPKRPPDRWNSHGFTMALESKYHMMPSNKIDELRARTIDPDAIPCMIPISAHQDFNSDMWQDLSKRLRNEEISFLIDDLQFEQNMLENKKYIKMSSEERTNVKIGYVQTTLLINEAINLSAEWRNGRLKLTEPRNGYKDRIVALAYFNIIATQVIDKLEKDSQQSNEIDFESMQLVF